MATRAQDREALKKIREIILDLGPDSYIWAAMDGVLDIAVDNIENDFMDSLKGQRDRARAELKKVTKERDDARAEVQAAWVVVDQKEKKIGDMEAENLQALNTLQHKAVECKQMRTKVADLEREIEQLKMETIILKAKLYDLMIAGA